MLASQMIYTACGKDKSGAFSVWAKSADVTKAECDEIVKLMSYRKPSNAPYEPTDEELRTLFPKKYCYYQLSSGRKCITLTTYVGKVYSDMDARNGNFIIHAFIFKDLDGFNPFGFMKLNIFKTNLSYTEWHDNPAPEDLPVVDIEENFQIDESNIRNMLLGKNKCDYISLLQAIIDSANSNTTVTFNDSEENQLQIYSLIGVMLPACLYSTTTFCNQYSMQLDFSLLGSETKPVKIRNIFSGMINTAFNYQEQLDAGQYVFYFVKGICSQVKPKRYLSELIRLLESGNSLFSILKVKDKVNTIVLETGCDLDTAIAVYNVIQMNLTWFSSADEYTKAFSIASEHKYVDETAIAARLYIDVVLTGRWGRGREITPLIRFVYNHNGQSVKAAIIEKYFNELCLYGVSLDSSPESVLSQIKNNAPFPWSDFVATVVRNPIWSKYVDIHSTAGELYFVFDAAVLAVAMNFSDTENRTGYGLIVKIIKKSIAHSDYDNLKLYLNSASKLGSTRVNWLVETSLGEYFGGSISDEATLDFIFSIICSLDSEQEKIKLIVQLVLNNMQMMFFVPTYIKYAEQFPALFLRVENVLKTNREFSEFLFIKDAYVFKNATKVTYNLINEYFLKYYQAGYDNGVYLEKVKQYISNYNGNSKVVECVRIYKQVRVLSDTFADVLDVIDYIDREIFKLSLEELITVTPGCINSIIELNNRLIMAQIKITDKFGIWYTVLMMRGKLGEQICQDRIQRNTLYDGLNGNQLESIIKDHFNEALDLYLRLKKKKCFESKILLIAVYDKPLTLYLNTWDNIVQTLEKLGARDYYGLMADMMAYAFNNNDRFASTLRTFIQRYVETMKRSSYNKLFKKIIEFIPQNEILSVQEYMDKFSKEHMTFFEKLFTRKK